MKKSILILIAFFALSSCSKNDCDSRVRQLTKEYEDALYRTGGSSAAVIRINQQYNEKLSKIYSDCD
jgi:accessory colonization factor AcfC